MMADSAGRSTFARRLACQRSTFALRATWTSFAFREARLGLPSEARPKGERRMVDQIFPRWNPLTSWMRQIEDFQNAA
jgi:hypothetical protein